MLPCFPGQGREGTKVENWKFHNFWHQLSDGTAKFCPKKKWNKKGKFRKSYQINQKYFKVNQTQNSPLALLWKWNRTSFFEERGVLLVLDWTFAMMVVCTFFVQGKRGRRGRRGRGCWWCFPQMVLCYWLQLTKSTGRGVHRSFLSHKTCLEWLGWARTWWWSHVST